MARYGIVCLLIGCLSLYQEVSSSSTLAAQTTSSVETKARSLSHDPNTSNGSSDKPAITIPGLCDHSSVHNAAASDCKTVITQAQFEKIIDAIQPNMPMRTRREFALRYADALVMTQKAEQMGLDKGTNYEEQIKLARIQALSQDLKNVIQARASQISEKDVEDYYQNNVAKFDKAYVDRIYIPGNRQPSVAAEKKLSSAGMGEHPFDLEQMMKDEANNLRARAVAGEEFIKLQSDAYEVAGIKGTPPATSMLIRRTSLPQNQYFVMDLKPGEISPVLADANGYVIYRVDNKDVLSLDQSREEIKATLRSQHMQEEMRVILGSAAPTLDDHYFVQ